MARRFYKRRTKTKKSKSKGKKAYKNRGVVAISRGVKTGFPIKMAMRHRYSQVKTISTTSGAVGNYLWSCNGMYDPDISGSGHQPLYFDQQNSIYNSYTVVGSRIKITFTPAAENTAPIVVGCYINDDGAVPVSTLSTIMEIGSAKTQIIPLNNKDNKYLAMNWSLKKAFGRGATLANTVLRGDYNGNPSETQNFNVFVCSLDGVSSASVLCTIDIQYYAIWNELREIIGS